MFAGHDEGAAAWARIASLIETAKLNRVEPYAWLKSTLEAITASHPNRRIDDLLPWNFKPTSAESRVPRSHRLRFSAAGWNSFQPRGADRLRVPNRNHPSVASAYVKAYSDSLSPTVATDGGYRTLLPHAKTWKRAKKVLSPLRL